MSQTSTPKTTVTLADGRSLTYYGDIPARPADYPDRRQLPPFDAQSEARWDSLLGEWVIVASHRQDRTFQPAADQCPLCPSTARTLTEIPAPDYEVVVFENRFPTLARVDAGLAAGAAGAAVRLVRLPGRGCWRAGLPSAGARWSASARATRCRSRT